MPTATPSRTRPPAAAAALVLLLLLLGCTGEDVADGAQPQLGGAGTQPEQDIEGAWEAQLAPGAGGADPQLDAPEDDQQVVGDPAFVDGDFAQIPLPTTAEPYGDATVEDDVTVQSFEVTATSVNEVIDFYRGALEEQGWVAGQEEATGEQPGSDLPAQIRATWTRDGQTLLITAAGLDEDDSQMTLQLSG